MIEYRNIHMRHNSQHGMPHWPQVTKGPFDLSLSRMPNFLHAIGNPHLKLPFTIHVAGTNGKGSTIAYLLSILQQAHYSSHRYISPHIVRFTERIMLNNREIDHDLLYQYVEECRLKSQDIEQPSFFEGITGVAFLAFSRFKADALLLEVGLGGRLDATNIIPEVGMSVITPISFDHVEYLGDTIAQIAEEKAGIIKAHSPTVISWQIEEAMNVLKKRCVQNNSPYLAHGEHWSFMRNEDDSMTVKIQCPIAYLDTAVLHNAEQNIDYDINTQILHTDEQDADQYEQNFHDDEYAYQTLHINSISLKGIHQYINAATAAVAAWWLSHINFTNIDDIAIDRGIAMAEWAGRLERITKGSLASVLKRNDELWFDGAHNVAGAEMLAASIQDMNHSKKVVYLINGRTGNRDPRAFLQFFLHIAKMVCAVPVASEPNAEKPENIRRDAEELGFAAVVADDLQDAVQQCINDAGDASCIIIIAGSLYLAGDIAATCPK